MLACARVFRDSLARQARSQHLTEAELALLWECRSAADCGMSQSELAKALAVSPAQVSGLVERLRRSGLLQSRRSENDRRRQYWRLTPRGTKALQDIQALMADWVRRLDNRLGIAESDLLGDLLEQMQAALRGPREDGGKPAATGRTPRLEPSEENTSEKDPCDAESRSDHGAFDCRIDGDGPIFVDTKVGTALATAPGTDPPPPSFEPRPSGPVPAASLISGLVSLVLLLMAVIAAGSGCSRAYYRRQADQEVYNLIGCATRDPRWDLKDYRIQPCPAARHFDPFNPDCPPMPPDDPTSHRLMHCVDCKRGWPCWHCYGNTRFVENPRWPASLPRGPDGVVVLDRTKAVRLALLHSPDYQTELEDLYFSALDVTFERFRFDFQFFGGHSTFFTADGPARPGGPQSLLEVDNFLRVQKLLATGGELTAGLANSLVWQFAGPDEYSALTILDFSLVQPLLRGAGRAVALESLTLAERGLLANVRQMERFRQGFYAQVITGRSPGIGPSPGGFTVAGLLPTGGAGAAGILSLMEDQVRIRNQRINVAGLRDALDQLEAAYEADRIDRFQVDLARQSLYGVQSQLLTITTAYEDRLDAYKIAIGLPPDVPVKIDDPLLNRFDLIDPKLTAIQDDLSALLAQLRDGGPRALEKQAPQARGESAPPAEGNAESVSNRIETIQRQSAEVLGMVQQDFQALSEVLPRRFGDLKRLAAREESTRGDVDPSAIQTEALEHRVAELKEDFARQSQQLQRTLTLLEEVQGRLAPTDAPAATPPAQDSDRHGPAKAASPPAIDELVRALLVQLSTQLSEISLTQARVRLETIVLVPIDLPMDEAVNIARAHRLDWMNARAGLVDAWRQIEIAANALRSDLDVTFSGDIRTTDNNPVRFRGTTGRLRVGLEFDAPLARLVERNAYRTTLINYQRARRAYYSFEDRVSQGLRNTLRLLRLSQLNFELRRAGVRVAINQVDYTRERVARPPKPGETTTPSPTLARDLTGAFAGLLNAQNTFLAEWVDYEAQRMNLDFELGTMQLDACGQWIDPGAVEPGKTPSEDRPEELPVPQGLPMAELTETGENS